MADRSVVVRLRAEVAEFKAAMAQAERSVEQLGSKMTTAVKRNSGDLDTLATKAGAVGLALTALATVAVKKFADFDAAMSNVAASGEDARASLEGLRDAAVDAGQRTAYSATEAAGGIEALAKAGVSASDILSGGLDGALDLAASGNLSVADSADAAAVAMAQFGLKGSDVTHIADLLAAGAGKATGEVSDMAAALKQSGQVAAQTGLSIEETTAALAAFAQAGLLGSDAGTSLKTMLQRLSAPAGDARAEMERLGISAYDASGNFVGLDVLAGQLRDGMSDLTPEARNAALAVIFGSDAVRAATVLYENGAEGIATWTRAVNDQGYAAEVAAIKMDNLKGDLETLSGAVETALIGMGEAGDGPLRGLVQGATDAVNTLAGLPPAAQAAALGIIGGGGLVLLGVAGLTKLVISIAEARTAMEALGISTSATSTAMSTLGKAVPYVAIGALAEVVGDYIGKSSVATVETRDLARELTALSEGSGRAGDAIAGIFEDQHTLDFLPWVKQVETADDAISKFATSAREAMGDGFWERLDQRLNGWAGETSQFEAQISGLDAAFAEMVSNGQGDVAADLLDRFLSAAQAQGVPVGELRAKFTQYAGAVDLAGSAAAGAASDVEGATSALSAQEQAAVNAADAFQALLDAYDDLNGKNLNLIDATSAYEAALDGVSAALEENGKTTDQTTEAGRANMGVLTDLARKADDLATATYNQTGSQDAYYASLNAGRQALADTAAGFGMTTEQAWAFVDSVLAIPPAPPVTPAMNTDPATGKLNDLVIAIDSATGTVTVNGNPVPAETTLGELVGNIDASDGTVTINGNKVPAGTTLAEFVGAANTASGTVTIHADASPAQAALRVFAAQSPTITVGVQTKILGPVIPKGAGGATGGLVAENRIIRGYASGGLVPGRPPADPLADNVLATNGRGLFALRSGEYVSTEGSTRRNRGALAAGNRGATLAVVPGYAGGGYPGAGAFAQPAQAANARAVVEGPLHLSPESVRAVGDYMIEASRVVSAMTVDEAQHARARSLSGMRGRG